MKLTEEELTNLIKETIFNKTPIEQTISLHTGIGGAIDFTAAFTGKKREDVSKQDLQKTLDSGIIKMTKWEENGEQFMSFEI